ncbi:MAG: cell division protein FtsW [Bacteroidales bacterium]|nr:cell division protein FtsW [Bacteroidales bacterium]
MNKVLGLFGGDKWIWTVIILLSVFSILAVYSSTGTLAYKYQHGDTTYYLLRHFTLLFVGFLVLFFTHRLPYIFFKKIARIAMYLTIPLLLYTLTKGASLNEASRWIVLPGTGLSFQTSDLAKLTLVLFIARHLTNNQEQIKDFKIGYRPIITWILVVTGLIFLANFSTAAMLFLISIVMLFIGRVRVRYIAATLFAGLALLVMGYFIAPHFAEYGRVGTWMNRVERFLGDEQEEDDGNFQAEQSQIAIVKGGFLGKGPGNSEQRNFLPHPYSDFIFAIITEEYGLWGALSIIILYLVLFYRVGVIVRNSKSSFGSYVAVGIGLSLTIQAFINMGVAVGIFPVTGQTLPLVSMGGTSIFFTSAALGILLSISRYTIEKTNSNE